MSPVPCVLSIGLLVLTCSVVLGGAAQSTQTGPRRPNILLIVADDVGAEASSIYPTLAGKRGQVSSPTLERLAREGVVFDHAWANPMCSPTRATILTGLYGHHTGVLTAGDTLPTSTTSIFEFLSAKSPARYNTAVFGKWHLGGNVGAAAAKHVKDTGVPAFAGFLGAQIGSFFNWTSVDVDGRATPMKTYATTAITDFAIDFIANHRKTRSADPWFIDVSYNAAHSPFQAPPAGLHSVHLDVTPGTVSNTLPVYHAMIQAMDSEIGRLLANVDLAETVVIYVGDNGTPRMMKDPTARVRGWKQTVYEGGVRVPLVVAGAGVSRRNQREDALVVTTDLFDTIAALAGVPEREIASHANDGVNLMPLLSDPAAETGRRYAFTELCNRQQVRRYAIRDARYKLLYDNGTWGFFDLESDPMESRDLSGNPALASARSALAAQLASLKPSGVRGCFE